MLEIPGSSMQEENPLASTCWQVLQQSSMTFHLVAWHFALLASAHSQKISKARTNMLIHMFPKSKFSTDHHTSRRHHPRASCQPTDAADVLTKEFKTVTPCQKQAR